MAKDDDQPSSPGMLSPQSAHRRTGSDEGRGGESGRASMYSLRPTDVKDPDITKAKRIVIKIGTSSIVNEKASATETPFVMVPNPDNPKEQITAIEKYVKEIKATRDLGVEVVVVSSGAVGLGRHKMGLDAKPADQAEKMALAGPGNVMLMNEWTRAAEKYGITVGQGLITKENMEEGKQITREVFDKAITLQKQLVVINENDLVAEKYMKYGDNDTVGGIVAGMVNADHYIIQTDVDMLRRYDPRIDASFKDFEKNPGFPELAIDDPQITEPVSVVDKEGQTVIAGMRGGAGTAGGTGGMATKFDGANAFAKHGGHTWVVSAKEDNILTRLLDGEHIGTKLVATVDFMRAASLTTIQTSSSAREFQAAEHHILAAVKVIHNPGSTRDQIEKAQKNLKAMLPRIEGASSQVTKGLAKAAALNISKDVHVPLDPTHLEEDTITALGEEAVMTASGILEGKPVERRSLEVDTGEHPLGISANITDEDHLAEKDRLSGTSWAKNPTKPGGALSKESKLYSTEVQALTELGYNINVNNIHTAKAGQFMSAAMVPEGRRSDETYTFVLPRTSQTASDQVYLASKEMMAGRRPPIGVPLGNANAFKAGQSLSAVPETPGKGKGVKR